MSNLQSRPIGQARKASALFRRAAIIQGRTTFERVVGLALLLGSAAGNYLAFNNGAFAPFDFVALIAAVAVFLLLTALQWFYRPDIPTDVWWFMKIVYWCMGLNWKYCASVVVGIGLTIWGAQAIVLPIFQRVLAPLVAADLLLPASWLLLGVVSLVVEVIPENILVD